MRVSEGNLTQQYYCDYLTTLVGEIISGSADEPVRRGVHESVVFRNLFLHRMSVDGGFHARVLSAILHQPDDSRVLLELLAGSGIPGEDVLPVEEWLKREYASAVADANLARQVAASALLRSYISGTNQAAEIIAAFEDVRPQSWWQLETRRITIAEIHNSDMYFGVGRRPFWHEFPLNRYAAALAGSPSLPSREIYDCVVCIAGAWFSSLTREEMITWLNMPQPTTAEWEMFCAPLLGGDSAAALSTANWLYASGNDDAAVDLYANITLAFPGTPAEITAFEHIGAILRSSRDFDNAFEAYKNAFMASRGKGAYQIAFGLKNLCEVGEDLGEDMSEYYTRIAGIAKVLSSQERARLHLELAASCRKRHAYAEEYQYLERIIAEDDGDETLVSAALSRLTEMNSHLDMDGKPSSLSLEALDAEAESVAAVTRGNSAYFGFDPVRALRWYARSPSLDISPLQFKAAIAAGDDSSAFTRTPAEKAVALAVAGSSPVLVARELNAAVTNAWQKDEDIAAVIEPVLLHLSPSAASTVLDEVTARSTRDDERAAVCSAASRAFLSVGLIEEARSMLRMALRANPGREMRSRLFAELGWMECEAGSYQAAADACDAALKLNDRFPAAWAGRARALSCLEKYDEALDAAGHAVAQHPANPSYQHLRAALQQVSSAPVDPVLDLLFILPEPGYLEAAAVGYAARSTGTCPPEIWNRSAIEDVAPLRTSLQ